MLAESLTETFLSRLQQGLERKSLISCSRYAEKVRVMGPPFPGNWSFRHHPWSRGIMDCKAELVVGQKAAQMGYTDAALCKVFHTIDYRGLDVMYVLPTKSPDASDFSSGRFDPALELSPQLRRLFTDTDNVGHKRAGTASLYVRGSKSRSQLKSVPVNALFLDELDEMDQRNIPLAMERTSGQHEGAFTVWMISTPTIEGYGINLYYEQSTKNSFFFNCPSCSKMINLEYPRNIKITADHPRDPAINDSYYFCHHCKAELRQKDKPNFLAKGQWVGEHPKRTAEGFHINQMYSCAITPAKFAQKALLAKNDPASETEFYNSTMGVPHSVEGARVTDKMIGKATAGYKMYTPVQAHKCRLVTMGVDIGDPLIHFEIAEWYWEALRGLETNTFAHCKVIFAGEVRRFEELDRLMVAFRIAHCVLDLNPERRMVRDFCRRWFRRAHGCEYPRGVRGREITTDKEDLQIQVDRTSWLDLSLGRFQNNPTIALPIDIPTDYKEHMKALIRIYTRDSNENLVAKYVKGSTHDHYAHARNYNEIAFTLATANMGNRAIASPR